jgi:hypothetical protein
MSFKRFYINGVAKPVHDHTSLLSTTHTTGEEAQRADFHATWAHTVDATARIHELEDIEAPYTYLDDPIPLRKPVDKWLRRNCGKGGSWPFDAAEPWSRYGNEFGFHDAEIAHQFKQRFLGQ